MGLKLPNLRLRLVSRALWQAVEGRPEHGAAGAQIIDGLFDKANGRIGCFTELQCQWMEGTSTLRLRS